MRFFEEVQVAAFAFNLWRRRFARAVMSGRIEAIEAELGPGKKDEFSLWLESCRETDRLKRSPTLAAVETIHAETRRLAGAILECLKEGRQDEALQLLGPDRAFSMLSHRLIVKLTHWKRHALLRNLHRQMGRIGRQVRKTVAGAMTA
ncbi:MAG: hypothetical protein J0L75_13225 [Spirochaetes bacterium]|nr:hypothetical protein [Spirochaetota bacterium]